MEFLDGGKWEIHFPVLFSGNVAQLMNLMGLSIKVIVSVTTQNRGPTIVLKDPVGVRVNKGRTDLTRGAIFVIDHPKPGVWKLFVSPGADKHSFVVKVSGTANMDFDVIFVYPRGKMPPLPVPHPLVGNCVACQFSLLFYAFLTLLFF